MIIKKRREVDEINSSSMADIAFLLLVFFLVTTTIDPGEGLTMILPPYESDPSPRDADEIVKILVRSTGQVLFDGEIMSIDQIEENSKNKVQEFQTSRQVWEKMVNQNSLYLWSLQMKKLSIKFF